MCAPKNRFTLLEGSKTQSACIVACSYGEAKMWFIFWSYQDESILKMKSTSSSKWRALIKLFDKDQKCLSPFIEFTAFFCQSSSTGPGFPENSCFFQKCPEENSSKEPAAQAHSNLWCDSAFQVQLLFAHFYHQHKFCRLLWGRHCSLRSMILYRGRTTSLVSLSLCYSRFLGLWELQAFRNQHTATNTFVSGTEPLPEIPMSHGKPPVQRKHCISFSDFLYFANIFALQKSCFCFSLDILRQLQTA